jgi:hypothetical protein
LKQWILQGTQGEVDLRILSRRRPGPEPHLAVPRLKHRGRDRLRVAQASVDEAAPVAGWNRLPGLCPSAACHTPVEVQEVFHRRGTDFAPPIRSCDAGNSGRRVDLEAVAGRGDLPHQGANLAPHQSQDGPFLPRGQIKLDLLEVDGGQLSNLHEAAIRQAEFHRGIGLGHQPVALPKLCADGQGPGRGRALDILFHRPLDPRDPGRGLGIRF